MGRPRSKTWLIKIPIDQTTMFLNAGVCEHNTCACKPLYLFKHWVTMLDFIPSTHWVTALLSPLWTLHHPHTECHYIFWLLQHLKQKSLPKDQQNRTEQHNDTEQPGTLHSWSRTPNPTVKDIGKLEFSAKVNLISGTSWLPGGAEVHSWTVISLLMQLSGGYPVYLIGNRLFSWHNQ